MTDRLGVPSGPAPEPGQLVAVRHRRYLVTDVDDGSLDPGAPAVDGAQRLVSLSSLEDDGLGEELQVIWELEPGAQIHERLPLPPPVGFDPPQRLDQFLRAVRWGAISSADVRSLQSPFRSGIDIEPYQLDPVIRAIQMPRANLLIADDVGLGKTVEAGLVMQELILRQRVRRILIVCPAALQVQWRDQMRDKFGLEFHIVDSALMRDLRRSRGIHANPWTHFPRLITSIDFLKRERPLRLLREILPQDLEDVYPRRFDLLIVDEAHNIAPSGRGRYAIASQRTSAIRELVPHFEHKLFLTATPHNGYAESFTALLELLDNQRFARGIEPDRAALATVMVRRLKSEFHTWAGDSQFPPRQLDVLEVDYSDAERQAHTWLNDYTRLRREGVRHGSDAERTATEFVLKLLKKRLLSSPAAFARTLAQHEESLTRARSAGATAPRPPAVGILRALVERVEDELDEDDNEGATEEAVLAAAPLFHELSPEERGLLRQLRQWADDAAERADRKAAKLLDWLKATVKPGGQWSDERVLLFTEYRDTQKWLVGQLAAHGLAGERLLTLYGGMDSQERERIKAAFQASPADSAVRILVATDAASEGIDLQLHCHRLVHYEIPWNPNRMEQRNGRIDRHGQRFSPEIYHFAPAGFDRTRGVDLDVPVGQLDGDLEFLMRAVQKVEQIREDLGKVGPVIADQVSEAMLGRRRRLDTHDAERDARPAREALRFEQNIQRQIERAQEQLRETQLALDLTPDHVRMVVETALDLAGQPPLREEQRAGVGAVYYLPPLHGSWQRAAEGLAHPHTGRVRPLVFDPAQARGRDDVVLAHLNHRLVQMSLRLLREEGWSNGGGTGLYHVTARVVPDALLTTPAVLAHARLVVTGADGHRLHEEVIAAGGEINDGRFRRLDRVGRVEELLREATDTEPSAAVKDTLRGLWPRLEDPLRQALEARMRERTATLGGRLAERADKEAGDIEAILSELAASIRAELAEPEVVQLELFANDEREELERNLDSLRRRLERIPGEIEKETERLRRRYADPQPRLFPVAVTFLVPARLAHR